MPESLQAAPASHPSPVDATWSKALTYGAFPVLMFGGAAAGLTLLSSGVAPRFVNPLLVPIVFVALTILERLHPHHASWNRSRGDLSVDIRYFFVSSAVVLVNTTALSLLLLPLGAKLADHAPFMVWPREWPLLSQLGLALVVSEFGHYWVHRLQHETALWRFHAVHHSAPRLYWLNAARFHPVDLMLSGIAGFGPLILLGCPEATLAMFTLVGTIHNVFQHANVKLRLGPLNYLFSMAEMHRWHHSRKLEEANANYGGHLIFWDLVFGTRFLPEDREPPEDIGLSDLPRYPTTLWKQLAAPFRWEQIQSENATPSGDAGHPGQ
jgi:sterol desaturase/sphingolipid hydroxylase (fatty acid hydroxylase superfamily)